MHEPEENKQPMTDTNKLVWQDRVLQKAFGPGYSTPLKRITRYRVVYERMKECNPQLVMLSADGYLDYLWQHRHVQPTHIQLIKDAITFAKREATVAAGIKGAKRRWRRRKAQSI